MRIAQEEIFGPVIVVIPYDGVDDAVRIANDSRTDWAGRCGRRIVRPVWRSPVECGPACSASTRSHPSSAFLRRIQVQWDRSGVRAEAFDEYVEMKSVYGVST
jgi:acyl-CoA reductase-like NAD-dependent aldehyde dehydrogenase